LLHVLQSGEFSRLGSEREIHTDTWVIAATNHELEADIRQEKFREDLFYRLNIIKILIQPLRERPEDLPPLIEHFVNEYAYQFQAGRINAPNNRIVAKMCEYHWPGNVRELQNVLKRGFALGNWDEIIDELFSHQPNAAFVARPAARSEKFPILNGVVGMDLDAVDLDDISLKAISRSVQDRVEREVISYVLDKCGWNRSKASRILKISYKALLYKIKDLNIQIPA
jgi:DNA-binding NtrC family response regulator